MPTEMIISLCVSGAIALVLIAFVVTVIVMQSRIARSYLYHWQSHEIVAKINRHSVSLLVDGKLEDETSGKRMYACTLRAFVEGTEVKVHLAAKGFRVNVEATAGGSPLQLIATGK